MITMEGFVAHCRHIGPRTFLYSLELGISPDELVSFSQKQFTEKLRIPEARAERIATFFQEHTKDELEAVLHAEQISLITYSDPLYPPLLKQIYDPPIGLFIRGDLRDVPCLAVVGPRAHSTYAAQVGAQFTREISARGIGIVSGLANGIDTIAHEAALKETGYTIAVLGSGVDALSIGSYRRNQLSKNIITSGGAVLSEYPPNTPASKTTFPRRNRIIAGLSHTVLVVEAGVRSGALITASCAVDMNRDVFVIPQNITSDTAAGSNALIGSGAIPALSPEVIFESFHLHNATPFGSTARNQSALEKAICERVNGIHIDELTGMFPERSIDELYEELDALEDASHILHVGGGLYRPLH